MESFLQTALNVFPARKTRSASLYASGRHVLSHTHAEYLRSVITWPDLLTLPDEAFGIDPYAFKYNVANIMTTLDDEDFVSFLPGWTIVVYERPLSLGILSMLIGNLHPEGVRAATTDDNGKTNLENIIETMSPGQISWLVSMLENILELCGGPNAEHQSGVRRTLDYWSSFAT